MKRIILLFAILFVFTFTACSGQENKPTVSDKENEYITLCEKISNELSDVHLTIDFETCMEDLRMKDKKLKDFKASDLKFRAELEEK